MFNHHQSGTDETVWSQHRRLYTAPRLEVPGRGNRMVLVAAHPDDETLGSGGLIAAAGARGAHIDILVATDGEASHPASPTHSPQQLGALRRAEVAAAVAVLAPTATVAYLGLPDGQLDHHRPALTAAVERYLSAGAVVVTPWRGDRHPDHRACALAARSLLRQRQFFVHWQYPVWAWLWADPDIDMPWDTIRRVDLDPDAQSAKAAALACHRSQQEPLSAAAGDEALLNKAFLAHFRRNYETFVVEPARQTAI